MGKRIILFAALTWTISIAGINAQTEIASPDSTLNPFKTIMHDIKSRIELDRQELAMSEDDIRRRIDSLPPFSIYKDNYLITGIPLNRGIKGETADAKIQVSIRHRLTTSRLPFDTFLYLTYTQKSFWSIYRQSAPFKDNNYNPGIGLGRYIIVDNQLTGAAFLSIEHESNGRDSLESRSTNWIGFSGKYFITSNLAVGLKVTIPYLLGEENSDLLDYRGAGYFSADYKTKNNHWWFSTTANPKNNLKALNLRLTAGYKIADRFNQYIFGELYSGSGDSLLDYKRKDVQLRLGICIKPDFYSVF